MIFQLISKFDIIFKGFQEMKMFENIWTLFFISQFKLIVD